MNYLIANILNELKFWNSKLTFFQVFTFQSWRIRDVFEGLVDFPLLRLHFPIPRRIPWLGEVGGPAEKHAFVALCRLLASFSIFCGDFPFFAAEGPWEDAAPNSGPSPWSGTCGGGAVRWPLRTPSPPRGPPTTSAHWRRRRLPAGNCEIFEWKIRIVCKKKKN